MIKQLHSFKEFLGEAVLTHLEHPEDGIFDYGHKGGVQAIAVMKDLIDSLSGNVKKPIGIQTKVDGAPSVVCGIDPETKKFFVGTKSIFNKNPKVNFSEKDVDDNHGHAPGLAEKLKIALKEFPKLGIKNVVQGDFLFIPSDLKTQTIDGASYVTFTPNTITYAVPVNSGLAKRMKRAKVGVVWHTTYTGSNIADMSAVFSIDISKMKETSDVWFTDTNFKDVSGVANFTKAERDHFLSELDKAQSELDKLDKASMDILFGSEMSTDIKVYINSRVRSGSSFSAKKDMITGMIDFLKDKNEKKIQGLKSDKAKEKARTEFNALMNKLRTPNVLGTLGHAFAWHNSMQVIKKGLITKLEKVQNIPSFVQTENGFDVIGPEGFVIIDVLKNQAVKLVDRMEFSRQNFNALKSWK
jgi:hypothetical protein